MEFTLDEQADALTIIDHDPDAYELGRRGYSIPLTALATYSELLGLTDLADTVDAIIHFRKRDTEPDPAGRAQENAWTETYQVATHLEQLREEEARQACQEGTAEDPRSPELRGAVRVRKEMDELAAGGDCLLSSCQGRARRRLGIPDPVRGVSAVRGARLTCEPEPQTTWDEDRRPELTGEDRQRLAALLGNRVQDIQARRRRFCHQLTGNEYDPLDPEPDPPEDDPEQITLDVIRRRRQETP
jgi:hypothetical protein